MAESSVQLLKRERIRRKIYMGREEARRDVLITQDVLQPEAPAWLSKLAISGRVREAVFQPDRIRLGKPGRF